MEIAVDPPNPLDVLVRHRPILEDDLLVELGQLQYPILQFLSCACAVLIQYLQNMLPGHKQSLQIGPFNGQVGTFPFAVLIVHDELEM